MCSINPNILIYVYLFLDKLLQLRWNTESKLPADASLLADRRGSSGTVLGKASCCLASEVLDPAMWINLSMDDTMLDARDLKDSIGEC